MTEIYVAVVFRERISQFATGARNSSATGKRAAGPENDVGILHLGRPGGTT
jgi:hypothetical protein